MAYWLEHWSPDRAVPVRDLTRVLFFVLCLASRSINGYKQILGKPSLRSACKELCERRFWSRLNWGESSPSPLLFRFCSLPNFCATGMFAHTALCPRSTGTLATQAKENFAKVLDDDVKI